MVARLAGAFLAIFDGSCRAIADAGHALCAVGSPDGTGVLQCDVIQRAELFAFSAADADIACGKGICLHKQRIENRVHRAARDAVVEFFARRREHVSCADRGDRAVDERLGFGDDPASLLDGWRVEHGDEILRHDDLRRAHAGEIFFLTEAAVVAVGIADLAAAVHDEPRFPRAAQFCSQQMVAHDARDAPGVGRHDEDEPSIDGERCYVA